jgi:hypothetical protein
MDPEDDDLMADIKAAINPTDASNEPAETPASSSVEQSTSERARDELGRFAPKETNEPEQPREQAPADQKTKPAAEPQGQEAKADPAPETIRPPATWSAEAKAAFINAPRDVQQQMLRAVEDMEKGKQTWETKAEAFNRLDKVIAPHREKWALNGVQEDQAIAQLLAAQNFLERDPVSAIRWLAQSYNLNLEQVFGRPAAHPQGQQPVNVQQAPVIQQLAQQVQTLQQQIANRDLQEQEAHRASMLNEIERFATDPAHMYFENVRAEVAALIRIGDQTNDNRPISERLKEAYTRACRANDTVWKLIQADEDKRAKEALRARDARNAAGSVAGAPGPGRSVQVNAPTDDLEADIRNAMSASR